MCLELRLRSLCSPWVKIAMPTCSTATISAVSPAPVAQANVCGTNRGTSAVTYHTSQGTYFGFHNDAGTIRAYKITPTNPPTITFALEPKPERPRLALGHNDRWNQQRDRVGGRRRRGDQRLHGYDGDTGAVIYAGGGTNELMTGTRQWNTGMVARGSIYFGADNKVYAFRLPAGTPTPTPTASPTAYSDSYSYRDRNCHCYGDCDATSTPTSTPTATATATPTSSPTPM